MFSASIRIEPETRERIPGPRCVWVYAQPPAGKATLSNRINQPSLSSVSTVLMTPERRRFEITPSPSAKLSSVSSRAISQRHTSAPFGPADKDIADFE